MIEVNLIPDIKQELIKTQRTRAVVVSASVLVSLFSVGVVVLLAVYIFTIQTVRGVLADNAIKNGSANLSKVEDLSKMLTIQNQLSKISSLNDNKKIDSRIFDVLKSVIPKSPNDIKVSKLLIDPTAGTVSVDGQAQAGYAALEVFKKTIEGATLKYKNDTKDGDYQEVKLASEVTPSETSYGEDASGQKVLRFTITFKYAEELFSPSSKSLSVVISTSGNATDSYLGVPKSVFVDRAKDIDGE